jgi:hypothetical protein
VNENIEKEKEIIGEFQNSQDAKKYLLHRLLSLNFNVKKFIEYLFKKHRSIVS